METAWQKISCSMKYVHSIAAAEIAGRCCLVNYMHYCGLMLSECSETFCIMKAVISLQLTKVVIMHYMKADWCSLALCSPKQQYNFAICLLVFWFVLVVLWFMLAKHYGKAESVMKWVWMEDLCESDPYCHYAHSAAMDLIIRSATLIYLLGQKVGYFCVWPYHLVQSADDILTFRFQLSTFFFKKWGNNFPAATSQSTTDTYIHTKL